MVHIHTLQVVVRNAQVVGIHTAEAEDQRCGLHGLVALFLHGNTCVGADGAVAGGIDDVLGFQSLGAAAGVHDDVGQVAVLMGAAGDGAVVMQLDTCFQQHALGYQLVDFGVMGHVAQGMLHLRASDGFHAADELPGNTAADQLLIIGKNADGKNKTGCCHTAGETELLNHSGFCTAAGCCYGCNPAGGAAAADYYIVAADHGNFTGLGDCIHKIQRSFFVGFILKSL